ncbi:anti-sigma 24 factor, partial [Methylobacterium frigidaeris]
SVTLGPGEGVDVDADQGALEVRRWPQARVRALLERFGR